MPPQYSRKPFKFTIKGVNVRYPADLLPDGYMSSLSNLRPRTLGGLTIRSGYSKLNSSLYPSAIHSIRRLNDPTTNLFKRIIGAGPSIFDDSSTLALDTGYSGSPLSMVPMRPAQSPSPWMYVSDAVRSQKFDVNRHNFAQGITPPSAPLTVNRTAPNDAIVSEMDAVADASWSATNWGVAGQAGAIAVSAKFGETIDQILYDSGTTGWCLIKTTLTAPPDLPAKYQVGARVHLTQTTSSANEFAKIRQINKPITTTTISNILYDSGSTGLCSIALATPGNQPNLVPDTFVQLGGTSEYVRVLSVSSAPDGSVAFRCSTVNTHAAADAVTGVYSFRTYTTNTYRSGAVDTITGNMFSSLITLAATNIGWLQLNATAASRDFSGVGGRPIQPSDYVHVSFKIDVPANVSRLRFYFNLDSAFPTFSTIPNALYYQVPSASITSGWNDIFFRVSDLLYTGTTTPTPPLGIVTGLIIEAVAITGNFTILVNSWWIGSTYGPDSKSLIPYSFYQRYRSALNGSRSNPSPITRSPIDLWREGADLIPTASADPQVDTIDLFVIGGTLTHPVLFSSGPNTSATVTFSARDVNLLTAETLEFNLFQPFPVSDLPRKGTVNVSGTSVAHVSGDTFNLSWQSGSIIIINGTPYTLYRVISTVFLETVQNAGSGSAVAFSVPEATIGGHPLPSMWGPDPITGVLFGCGLSSSPNTVFWTNPNDPDTAADTNNVDVTSPSEPLVSGFMYDGRSYAYSSERLFQGYPQTTTDPTTGISTLSYTFQEVPNGRGAFTFAATAVKKNFWSVARTGIWQYGDEGLGSITSDDLYPLFPHDGHAGTITTAFTPPVDFTQPAFLRLFPTDDSLYFTYRDSFADQDQCLMYDLNTKGWWPTGFSVTPRVIYQEEGPSINSVLMGGSNGRIYTLDGSPSDDGAAIPFSFVSPYLDLSDPRAQKLFLDAMIDLDPQGVSITAQCLLDNGAASFPSSALSSASGRAQQPMNLIQSPLALHRNIALSIGGQTSLGSPVFYEFEPNALIQPFLAVNFTTQFQSHGFTTYGHIRDGYFAWLSTTIITITITTGLGLTFTFTLPSSSGVLQKQYVPLAGLKGLLFFYSATSTSPFALFTDESIVRMKEWGSSGPYVSVKPWAGQTA